MTTPDTIRVRFFARLREELDTGELELPAGSAANAGDIARALAEKGGPWQQLAGDQPVLVAVNQIMAKPSTPVKAGDEVAFFPPVTGG
ncbi:molybdopterin converting factor subunit 1 [Marinobacter sp.]|jgi:molybdopterin synthase sulfur carrier subunit|uniref:molybdopterin converting factor subunit 1 n=1 Tax=Marinobacter sp. TaxID=50741 RepID=UPI00198F851D|nr:molybdopterin converting factor subunit 1 [Marinobacter sp.]MBC7193742.1 molybdopterin converting factor subunit 1 [Marinobacter sp.]